MYTEANYTPELEVRLNQIIKFPFPPILPPAKKKKEDPWITNFFFSQILLVLVVSEQRQSAQGPKQRAFLCKSPCNTVDIIFPASV